MYLGFKNRHSGAPYYDVCVDFMKRVGLRLLERGPSVQFGCGLYDFMQQQHERQHQWLHHRRQDLQANRHRLLLHHGYQRHISCCRRSSSHRIPLVLMVETRLCRRR